MFKQFLCSSVLSISFNKLASYAIITISLLSAIRSAASQKSAENPAQLLKVQLYYETLCPDSKRFIRNEFYDAMIEKRLLNYTDLQLIPYGKVTIWVDPETQKEHLNCQHGQRECDLNALHACIVENNNKMEQLQMIDCLVGGFTIENCSDMLKIDVSAALKCKNSRSVEDILKKYGEQTNAIDLWFVPSVALDGNFNPEAQNGLLGNFAVEFCKKYKAKYNVSLKNCS